ncbi:MAG: hypothetical protein WBX11_02150 [Thiobacillaceae bacterium]
MSLLPRNQVRIELAPNYVNLQHVARSVTLRGYHSSVVANGIFSASAVDGEAAAWGPPIHTLETILSEHAGIEMPATVLLSNHFVRYVLVPWSESLREAAELESYARHCFSMMYGEAVGQWDVRVSPDRPGRVRLASAVEPGLLSALRAVMGKTGVRLHSVQPYSMAVFNDCRHHFRRRDAWFALLEPGILCLALLQHGHWARVRCLRIGNEWRTELGFLLEREAYLADGEAATDDVFLWATGMGELNLPDSGRWQIHVLASDRRFGPTPALEEPVARAMDA